MSDIEVELRAELNALQQKHAALSAQNTKLKEELATMNSVVTGLIEDLTVNAMQVHELSCHAVDATKRLHNMLAQTTKNPATTQESKANVVAAANTEVAAREIKTYVRSLKSNLMFRR